MKEKEQKIMLQIPSFSSLREKIADKVGNSSEQDTPALPINLFINS